MTIEPSSFFRCDPAPLAVAYLSPWEVGWMLISCPISDVGCQIEMRNRSGFGAGLLGGHDDQGGIVTHYAFCLPYLVRLPWTTRHLALCGYLFCLICQWTHLSEDPSEVPCQNHVLHHCSVCPWVIPSCHAYLPFENLEKSLIQKTRKRRTNEIGNGVYLTCSYLSLASHHYSSSWRIDYPTNTSCMTKMNCTNWSYYCY